MKKLIIALMAVLFLGSTTGLVMAQDTAANKTTTTKAHKGGKKHKHSKKGKKATADTSAPAAAPATTK